MFVQSSKRTKIIGISLLSLVLGACNLPSEPEPGISQETQNQLPTGKATIRLPAFPAGSLAKSSTLSGTEFGCTFLLDITFPGQRGTLTYRWDLRTFDGPLVVDRIPVGSAQFVGRLITASDEVTHSGSVTVEIQADQMTDVNLLLLKTPVVGDAVICVDVEGLPTSGCAISHPISLRELSSCWALERTLANIGSDKGIMFVNTGVDAGTQGHIVWATHDFDSVSDIWADMKWGMAGFITNNDGGESRTYQGPFQSQNSIQDGIIQSALGYQIGTFTATPMDCPN